MRLPNDRQSLPELFQAAEETTKEVEAALKKEALIRQSGNRVHSFFVTDAPIDSLTAMRIER
jgi:hypothetical protein